MKEIRQDAPGPCLLMAWPKESQNETKVQEIFDVLFNPSRMYKSPLELWRDPNWVNIRRKGVVNRTHLPMIHHWWQPPQDGRVGNAMMIAYHIDSCNAISGPRKPPIVIDGYDVLAVWGYHCQVPPDDSAKYGEVVATYRKVCNVLRPPFALVDHFTANVKPRQKEDLQRRVWGVTVFGPDLVKRIGSETLASAPDCHAENLPWGGVWLQLGDNPFAVDTGRRQAVERHLGLKELSASDGTKKLRVKS